MRSVRRRLGRRAGSSVPARSAGVAAGVGCGGTEPCRWDADQAVTVLYDTHYRDLIRLAALLANDVTIAEEFVQDAFVTMHSAWRQLRDSDEALSYLRRTVVSRSRSHRPAHPEPPGRQPALPDGGQVIIYPEPDPLAALRTLPSRQREALVLRYYADFPDTQVAFVMGISTRAVNNHIARGMFSLQAVPERRAAPRPARDSGPA